MIEKIAIFYFIAFTLYLLVHIFYKSKISIIALTWFGPIPQEYEYLSEFKLRRLKYAFGWALQFIYALCIAFGVVKLFPAIGKQDIFLVLMFGLTIGLGMTTLSSLGFLVSYSKTRLFGPDPYFEPIEDVSDDEI